MGELLICCRSRLGRVLGGRVATFRTSKLFLVTAIVSLIFAFLRSQRRCACSAVVFSRARAVLSRLDDVEKSQGDADSSAED